MVKDKPIGMLFSIVLKSALAMVGIPQPGPKLKNNMS